NRRVYIAKSNWSEYTHATEDIAALVWAVRVIRDERERAAAMADVAKRTLATLPPDTKVALFAHATQVSRRPEDHGMGALLAADLKKQYLPIGMTFYQGWIRAWDFTKDPGAERGTKLFRLAPAEPGTLESLLAGAGASMFYADVRKAPPSLAPWFSAPLPMRSVGAAFESDRRARTRTVVKDAFDGLVFVKKLTTVRVTETGKRPAQREWD
ncbi:MAG: erythromycin esterase family protein, partial [Polyangiaceae bacterium]